MSRPSEAYTVTAHLHDAFFETDSSLSPAEIGASGVNAVIGSTSSKTAKRLEAYGLIDNREAKQTLSKDRFGNFHLSTTFLEVGGEHVQADIHSESPPESFDVITRSFFMQALVSTLADRQQN